MKKMYAPNDFGVENYSVILRNNLYAASTWNYAKFPILNYARDVLLNGRLCSFSVSRVFFGSGLWEELE